MKKCIMCLALAALLLPGVSNAQMRGVYSDIVWLSENDSLDVRDLSLLKTATTYEDETCNALSAKYGEIIRSSVVMKAVGVNEDYNPYVGYYDDFVGRLRFICRELLNWTDGMTWSDYVGKLKNKVVRDFLFKVGCDMVCEMCKKFPKDFYNAVVSSLNQGRTVLNNLKLGRYQLVRYSDEYYSIDYVRSPQGEELRYDSGHDIEVFLALRVLSDGVSADDLLKMVDQLSQRLRQLDVKDKPDVVCYVSVNNSISIVNDIHGCRYLNSKGEEIVIPECEYYCTFSDHFPKIIYQKDGYGSYFLFKSSTESGLTDEDGNVLLVSRK